MEQVRNSEVCYLIRHYEIETTESESSVFSISKEGVDADIKNQHDCLVERNRVAGAVINCARGDHPEWVFTYKGSPLKSMYNTAWKRARKKERLPVVGIHYLRHTVGRKLYSAGVSFEDRQDLLGHKFSRIKTHYSTPELVNLIQSSNRVCGENPHTRDSKKKSHLQLIAKLAG